MTLHQKLKDKKSEIGITCFLYNENRKLWSSMTECEYSQAKILDEVANKLIDIQGRLFQEHSDIVKEIMKDE